MLAIYRPPQKPPFHQILIMLSCHTASNLHLIIPTRSYSSYLKNPLKICICFFQQLFIITRNLLSFLFIELPNKPPFHQILIMLSCHTASNLHLIIPTRSYSSCLKNPLKICICFFQQLFIITRNLLCSLFIELPKNLHLFFPITIYNNNKSAVLPIYRTPKKATTVPPDINHAKMSHGIESAVDYSNKKLSSQFLELPKNVHLEFPTTIYNNKNKSVHSLFLELPKKPPPFHLILIMPRCHTVSDLHLIIPTRSYSSYL